MALDPLALGPAALGPGALGPEALDFAALDFAEGVRATANPSCLPCHPEATLPDWQHSKFTLTYP